MTIKNLLIEYDAINSRNTFSNGDSIHGRIIMETSKEAKIQSLSFTATGYAKVSWSESYGQHDHRVYWAEEKYYELKHHILREARQDGTDVIGPGRHVFPFTFTVPNRKMPSSYKSSIGKIVHKLKAELKQSMKITKTSKVHFSFVSKADMDFPGLMDPQHFSKDKSIKAFGSGTISVDVHTKRMGYQQGETLRVTVDVINNASRSLKPKFVLYQKKSYFAQGHRRMSTHEILKEKAEPIKASSRETVTQMITVPSELPPSILNCSIIKLEYRMKVLLEIKYASDPEIKFPIVILPEVSGKKELAPFPPPAAAAAAAAAAPHFGFEGQNYPTRPNTNIPAALQPMDPPPPYAHYPMYPPL